MRRRAGGLRLRRGKSGGDGFYNGLLYLYNHLIHLSDPQKRTHYRKTVLSVTVRLRAALDVQPGSGGVRAASGPSLVREHSGGAGAGAASREMAAVHPGLLSIALRGRCEQKTGKRLVATVVGGLISVALYSVIRPWRAGRRS